MRRLALLLLTAELLAASLGSVPETALPEAPAVVTPAPERQDALWDILQRLTREYDPAAGTVGAIRWAEKLLNAWALSGEEAETARRAAEGVDPEALAARLPRLQWAAEKLCSGADLGLMNEPGHRSDWSSTDIESLFDALREGAALPEE